MFVFANMRSIYVAFVPVIILEIKITPEVHVYVTCMPAGRAIMRRHDAPNSAAPPCMEFARHAGPINSISGRNTTLRATPIQTYVRLPFNSVANEPSRTAPGNTHGLLTVYVVYTCLHRHASATRDSTHGLNKLIHWPYVRAPQEQVYTWYTKKGAGGRRARVRTCRSTRPQGSGSVVRQAIGGGAHMQRKHARMP